MSKTHRLTPVQRSVVSWLHKHGASRIYTGFKKTELVEPLGGDPEIRCQTIVSHFLRAHGYIEHCFGENWYQLTAIGKQKASPRVTDTEAQR